MKFILTSIFILTVLSFQTFGQETKPSPNPFERMEICCGLQRPPKKEQIKPEQMCSPTIEGLKLCTTTANIKSKIGQKVALQLSLKNETSEEKTVETLWKFSSQTPRYPPYEVIITDESGNKFPTIEETLARKQSEGTITQEESNDLYLRCCINKGSRWGNATHLNSQEELKFEWYLNQLYDFKSAGKFYIEVRRNVAMQDEKTIVVIPLKSITLKIE